MNPVAIWTGAALAALLATASPDQDPAATSAPHTGAVVGTFDSRAVAIAYVRSDEFTEYVSAQKADIAAALERATAHGDAVLAAALAELGPKLQGRIHRQGFGTAPVDDILERVAKRLPEVAREAGVDVVVSKWRLTYQRPGSAAVDVTERIAALFEPSEATWQAIREVVRKDPIPEAELGAEH